MDKEFKDTLSKILIIIAFFSILILPNLCFVDRLGSSIVSTEKRELAKFPDIRETEIRDFPSAFEAFYNDNMPYRNFLVWTGSAIKYYMLNDSTSEEVVIGKNGWLFYKNDYGNGRSTMADYKGINLFSEEEMNTIASRMKNISDYVQAQGGKFMVYVSPNKSRIYPEYMNEDYGEMSSVNMGMQLGEYIRKNMPNVTYMYYPEDFYDAKELGYDLYMKGDTHWNGLGAFVAFNRIMSTVHDDFVSLDHLEFDTSQDATADLADIMSLKFYSKGKYVRVTNYKPEITLEDVEMINNGNSLWRIKSSNKNGKKLLIYGDSFTPSLKNYIAKEYEETVIINRWYKALNIALLNEEKPDDVLIHRVERGVCGFTDELSEWKISPNEIITNLQDGVYTLLENENSGQVQVSCEYGLATHINWYNGLETNLVLFAKDDIGEHILLKQPLEEGHRYNMNETIDTSSLKGDISFSFIQVYSNGVPTNWDDVTINDLVFYK